MKTKNKTKWQNLWTLECNQEQNKFHIQEASGAFQTNYENFIQDLKENWSILGVFDSYEECEKYKEDIVEKKIFVSSMVSLEKKGKLKLIKYEQ